MRSLKCVLACKCAVPGAKEESLRSSRVGHVEASGEERSIREVPVLPGPLLLGHAPSPPSGDTPPKLSQSRPSAILRCCRPIRSGLEKPPPTQEKTGARRADHRYPMSAWDAI